MSWHAFGHFLKDVAPVVAMFTSLFLLWQGQRDRRRSSLERRRDQVDQLVLTDSMRAIDSSKLPPGLRESVGSAITEFTVRNESKAALQVLGVTEVHPTKGGPLSTSQLENDRWPALLKPGDERQVMLSADWSSVTFGPGQPYVVVMVRDAHGRLWRKRSDTAASKPLLPRQVPPFRAHFALWLRRHWWGQLFWWFFYSPLDRRVSRVRDFDPDHTAWALRLSRWVWGRWDAEVDDPWLYPGAVPWRNERHGTVSLADGIVLRRGAWVAAALYTGLGVVFWWAASILRWAHPGRFSVEVVLVMVALVLCHEVAHGVVGVRVGERWERLEVCPAGFRVVLETHGRRTQRAQLLISLAGPVTGMAGAGIIATAALHLTLGTWRPPLLWGAAAAVVMDVSNLVPLLPGSDGRKALTAAWACVRGHGHDLVPGQTPEPPSPQHPNER